MSHGFRVAVLGATGLVGQQMIEILAERKFPVAELFPLASARSAGATVDFNGEEVEVLDATEFDWSNADIAFSLREVLFPASLRRKLLRRVALLLIIRRSFVTNRIFL